MRLLLFGSSGQVGWELQRSLAPLGELVTLGRDGGKGLHADFSRPDLLAATVRAVEPDVIVNAAAHTAVDRAQAEPELAHAVNATAPGVLAREAAALGALLVHYSTDYVFDGSGTAPRDEGAPTGPLNVYGQSKLEGEQLVRASGCRHLILRTGWIYSARGSNFVKTMLRLAAEREQLTVIDDQIGAPTSAELLADVTAHAMRMLDRHPELAGTYHAVAAGQTNWHAYAKFVIEGARARGCNLKATLGAVMPVPTTAYRTAAQRPLNSRLGTDKLRSAFGLHLPHWQQGVARLLDEMLTQ